MHFGPLVQDEIVNRIRREAEMTDSRLEFMSIASLAGGTGSGLSTFIIQKVREDFVKAPLLTQTVLPFKNGEINT